MKKLSTYSLLKPSLRALTGATLLTLCAAAAHAGAVQESGDAGVLLGTAYTATGSGKIETISGSLLETAHNDYADLFRVYLIGGRAFSATTTTSAFNFNNFDTSLFLFDSAGKGVRANDDDPLVGPTSTLTVSSVLSSGYYYLAIAGAGYTPLSASGAIFGNLTGKDQVGPVGPGGAGALQGWGSVTNEGGDYQIALRGAYANQVSAVPEMAPVLTLLAGLGMLAPLVRRRQAASNRASRAV